MQSSDQQSFPPKPDFCEGCQKFTQRFKYCNWTIYHEVLDDHWWGSRGGITFSGPNPDVVKEQIDKHLIAMEELRPTVAHRCSNGDKIRPYGTPMCSMCLPNGNSENLSTHDLVNLINQNDEIKAAAKEVQEFCSNWWHYHTPGQGIGNPVHVPWNVFEQIEKIVNHKEIT